MEGSLLNLEFSVFALALNSLTHLGEKIKHFLESDLKSLKIYV